MNRPPLPPSTEDTALPKAQPHKEFMLQRTRGTRVIQQRWRSLIHRIAVGETGQSSRVAVKRLKLFWCENGGGDSGQWFRAYGNKNWLFNTAGLTELRFASINEHPISEAERKFRCALGRRPDDHPGLTELGL